MAFRRRLQEKLKVDSWPKDIVKLDQIYYNDFEKMCRTTIPRGSIRDYRIGTLLGRGKYGKVFSAKDKKTDQMCAIKVVAKLPIFKENFQHRVVREIQIHCLLDHANIVKYFTHFVDDKKIYIVQEFAVKGELFECLFQQIPQRFSEDRAARYMYQISDAIKYCHSKCVIHRDIKPENILLDENDNIKITDFGWSVLSPSNVRKTACGTPSYIPPEMASRKYYNSKVDIWGLGVLCYELLCGNTPFKLEGSKIIYKKDNVFSITYPPHLSKESIDFISHMVVMDPKGRMDIDEVLNHEWIVKNYKSHPKNNEPMEVGLS